MSKVSAVDKVCVCERVVNEEEFRQIGITQRFERLGWERVLDWCEGVTPRVFLKAVTNWYASLRLENEDEHPSQWRLVGDTGKGSMTMSFETMNQIANFDSLGVDNYFYYSTNTFWSSELVQADPVGLLEITLPNYTTGRYDRNHMSCEGKILQNISLENIMVRLGDRGKLRMWDLRILHALLVGTPKLSWHHITMMNIWDTRNQYRRKMIPCVRLISAMIFQQNRLKDNSLWILKG
ncbi:hypothetical protein HanLR1_Chr00c1073g0788861 [Helianthus annuus]|nr:hypothetical protein HanLR1_Chr00c1073g0788861 [Helianthus annuus]